MHNKDRENLFTREIACQIYGLNIHAVKRVNRVNKIVNGLQGMIRNVENTATYFRL